MKLTEIDKNFAVDTNINEKNIRFLDASEEPFTVFGLIIPEKDGEPYRRMPKEIAESISEGVGALSRVSAGGRVKFKTDSRYIAISVKLCDLMKSSDMAFTGSIGLDLYKKTEEGDRYIGTFRPPMNCEDGFESIVYREDDEGIGEFTINMPLYSGVTQLFVGLEETAQIEKCDGYKHKKPVVYYGSSITQGGSAARPGMAYENIVSRMLDCDHINLGFAGRALAEEAMSDYINTLDMSVFVYDYDHNAPDSEYLKKTHKPMFDKIRAKHPDLPIIMMSMPKYYTAKREDKRREVIEETYRLAKEAGDKNVYFIDGRDLMKPLALGEGLVDNVHPNDLGLMSIAINVAEVLKKLL